MASLAAQLVKNPPAMLETWVDPWVGKMPWRWERLSTPIFWPGKFQRGLKEFYLTEQLSLPKKKLILSSSDMCKSSISP